MTARSKGGGKAAPGKSATAMTQDQPVEPVLDGTQSGQAPAAAEEGGAQAGTDKARPLPRREWKRSRVTPLEYMLRVMRDRTAEPARRDEMAKIALPYVHLKPTAPEHGGKAGGPNEIAGLSETEIARRIAFIKRWGALLGEGSER